MANVALVAQWLDVLLALTLVVLAATALGTVDLLKAISLFIAFGLFMTLVWVRLHAIDVALAEASIGTGFTGALLLAAVMRLRRLDARKEAKPDRNQQV